MRVVPCFDILHAMEYSEKMPIMRYKFMMNPEYGTILEIGVRLDSRTKGAATRILRDFAESGCDGLNARLCEELGVCAAIDGEYPDGHVSAGPAYMQDGSMKKAERKPDGSMETFEEIVEREWAAAEIRRAAKGRAS